VDARCVPGAKTVRTAPNEHAATAARDAHQACAGSDRGSAHTAPHQHADGRGNGPTTGAGNASAKGGGNASAKGSDTAQGATAAGRSQDHPSGPPATPGGARNGPPG
jgi:hypothetical protein